MIRITTAQFVTLSAALNGFLVGVLAIVLVGDHGHVPFAVPAALAIACGLAAHRVLAGGRELHG